MTKPEFLVEHGGEYRKLSRKPMFDALLRLIDAESPAKKQATLSATDLHNGAIVFLNQSVGWEQCRGLLAGLSAEPDKEIEPEDKFTTPEKI